MDEEKMTEIAYYCPSCNSPAVDYSSLVGGFAKCNVCNWEGVREDLLAAPFSHIYGDQSGVDFLLAREIKQLLGSSEMTKLLVRFLARWGFVDIKQGRAVVVGEVKKYLEALAITFLKTIVNVRLDLEKEKVHAESRTDHPA
jgi:hypothetical protein